MKAQKTSPAGHGCRPHVCPPPCSTEVAGQVPTECWRRASSKPHGEEDIPAAGELCWVWTNTQSLPNSSHIANKRCFKFHGAPDLQQPYSLMPPPTVTQANSMTVQKVIFSPLWERIVCVHTHRGCRRCFLAASALGELSQDPAPISGFRHPMWNRPGESPRKNQKWGFVLPARHREGSKGTSLSANQPLLLPWEIRSKGKRGFLFASCASVKFSKDFLLVLDQVLDPCGQSSVFLDYLLAKGFPLQSSMWNTLLKHALLCIWPDGVGMKKCSALPQKCCWTANCHYFSHVSSSMALSKLCHKSSGFSLNSPPPSDILYFWIMLSPYELQGTG